MGSARAGARVGVFAGLFFSGCAAALNGLILVASKGEVVAALQNTTSCSGAGPANQAGTALSCYSALFTDALPIFFLGLLAISFLAALFFGTYFEFVPGRSYLRKALLVALAMLAVMLNIALPIAANGQQELIMILFELVLAVAYAFLLSGLYRRYTREVEFRVSDPSKMKILVGRRDQTGKKRTFSLNSTQTVEASVEGRPFKGWAVSGGVTVAEPKSKVTTMKVLGDGLLKAN